MTVRLALALLFIVPAAMAYPWDSNIDRWTLGVAIGVVLVLFAWWRGLFVTNMVGRRLRGSLRRPLPEGARHQPRPGWCPHDMDQHDARRRRQPRRPAGAFTGAA